MQKVKLWDKNFVIIILINFLVFLNHLMILSTFPFFVAYLGYGETISGVCVALFCIISVFLRPVVGYMLDTGKRRGILFLGILLMGLMPLGYLLVYTVFSSIALAMIFRLFHGAALAFSNTSTATVATDIIPKQRFSEGMGMFGMATALATAIAPAVGEWLMGRGFSILFLASSATMAVSMILFMLLKNPKIESSVTKFSVSALIEKSAMPASCTALIFLLTYGTLENYILKFASDSNMVTLPGGLYFTLMAIILLATRVFLGKAADKVGEEIFVYTCNAAMAAALLLVSAVPCNAAFIVSALLSGYSFGGLEPALQSMAVGTSAPDRRGAANSTFLCAYDIGIGLGGFIAGALIDNMGYGVTFAVMVIANAISVAVYIFWGRKHPSSITGRLKNNR